MQGCLRQMQGRERGRARPGLLYRARRDSAFVEVGEDVRLVSAPPEPRLEFLDADGAFLADEARENRASRLLGELLADTTLPGVREDRGHLVRQLQFFEQLPFAAIEPGLIAARADVDAIRHTAGELVLRHEPRAFRAHDGLGRLGRFERGDALRRVGGGWRRLLSLRPVAVVEQRDETSVARAASHGGQVLLDHRRFELSGLTVRTLYAGLPSKTRPGSWPNVCDSRPAVGDTVRGCSRARKPSLSGNTAADSVVFCC